MATTKINSKIQNQELALKQPWREVLAIFLIACAIFTILAIFTSDPYDLAIHTTRVNNPLQNAVGLVGAWFSYIFLFSIGMTAVMIPIFFLSFGIRFLFSAPLDQWALRVVAIFPLMATSCVLINYLPWEINWLSNSSLNLDHLGYGGLLGFWLYHDLFLVYLGYYGSLILLLGFWLASLIVITRFRFYHLKILFHWGVSQFVSFYQWIQAKIKDHKDLSEEKVIYRSPKAIKPTFQGNNSSKEKAQDPNIKNEFSNTKVMTHSNESNLKDIKDDIFVVEKQLELIPGTEYVLPSMEHLSKNYNQEGYDFEEHIISNGEVLQQALRDFGVDMQLVHMTQGPVITRYELQPAPGVKVQKILSLSNDIALAMKAESVRIIAPIPGKSLVGIEVPNPERQIVSLHEVINCEEFRSKKRVLPIALGKDVAGKPIVADLANMPHLLVAGATGTGKSICLNAIIINLLYYSSPNYLKFLMVDPKRVELSIYNKLPHLMAPVITEPKLAVKGLNWVVKEMENRYRILEAVGVRNIFSYNQKVSTESVMILDDDTPLKPFPYIVVIIDELADLMLTSGREVENCIARLAQLARAVGIHLIIATQRPSVDVITGIIKANFPARISFQVASKIDARTILDAVGSESLIGKGDMLYNPSEGGNLLRIQGAYISDNEIKQIIKSIIKQNPTVDEKDEKDNIFDKTSQVIDEDDEDDLIEDAYQVILQTKQASVSILQRRLRVGYTRAARLMDQLEARGIVGPYQGSKAREILVDIDEENGAFSGR